MSLAMSSESPFSGTFRSMRQAMPSFSPLEVVRWLS